MWGDHYEMLLNCVKSGECKEKIIDFLSSDNNIKNVVIQPCQVKEALKSAKLGKALAMMALLQSTSYLPTEAFVYTYLCCIRACCRMGIYRRSL